MKIATLAAYTALALATATLAQRPLPSTHKEPLDDGTGRELHTRKVRKLLDRLARPDEPGVERSEAERRAGARRLNRRLAEMIRGFVEPAFEAGEEARAIGDSHLVAVARPEQHAWIDRFLKGVPRHVDDLILIEVRLLQLDARARRELGFGDRPRVVEGAQRADLLRKIAARKDGCRQLMAPRVAAFGLQDFSVAVSNQAAYVKDFAVTVAADGSTVADPVVAVVESGVTFRGSAILLDQRQIGLLGRVEIAEVDRPFPEQQIEVVPGAPKVTIQTPHVRSSKTATDLAIPLAATAVFPVEPSRGEHTVVLVTARRGG